MHKEVENQVRFSRLMQKVIFRIITQNSNLGFQKISQIKAKSKFFRNIAFYDCVLHTENDARIYIRFCFSFPNASQNEFLPETLGKACYFGMLFSIIIFPNQICVYRTFIPNTTIEQRKILAFRIPAIQIKEDILFEEYEQEVYPYLAIFLEELSKIIKKRS
jgi:hypothetical protein